METEEARKQKRLTFFYVAPNFFVNGNNLVLPSENTEPLVQSYEIYLYIEHDTEKFYQPGEGALHIATNNELLSRHIFGPLAIDEDR